MGKKGEYLAMFTTGLPEEEIAISEGNRNILAHLETEGYIAEPETFCLNSYTPTYKQKGRAITDPAFDLS